MPSPVKIPKKSLKCLVEDHWATTTADWMLPAVWWTWVVIPSTRPCIHFHLTWPTQKWCFPGWMQCATSSTSAPPLIFTMPAVLEVIPTAWPCAGGWAAQICSEVRTTLSFPHLPASWPQQRGFAISSSHLATPIRLHPLHLLILGQAWVRGTYLSLLCDPFTVMVPHWDLKVVPLLRARGKLALLGRGNLVRKGPLRWSKLRMEVRRRTVQRKR